MQVKFLERKGTIVLLLFLFGKTPQRFRELRKVLPREATLSNRIKELEELNMIESVTLKEGRRFFHPYQLTTTGTWITSKLFDITKTKETI